MPLYITNIVTNKQLKTNSEIKIMNLFLLFFFFLFIPLINIRKYKIN
jgi:hypothetical protein